MAVIDKKQKLLIEYALSSKELFIKVIGVLLPQYFDAPLDNVIEFSLKYFREYHAIPDFDIIEAETGIELKPREVSREEFDFVTDEIETHCKNSAMRIAVLESVDHLEKNNFGAIQEAVKRALSVSVDKNLGTNFFEDPAFVLSAMMQNIDSRSIGWAPLDELLDYVRRGEMLIFAGGSGSGKSVFLANIANNMAAQKTNVLYITLELKEDLIVKRMASIVSGVASKEIFDQIQTVGEILTNMAKNYSNIHIKKMSAGICANDIRAYLMEYHLQFGYYPDAICVDYLDLLSPNDRSLKIDTFKNDKAISEELREIFIDYDAYGFTASQLNRDAVGTAQKTQAHIAGGISKINTSDATLAIIRNEEHIDRGEVELQPLKLRNAEMATRPITLFWDSKTLKISDKEPARKANFKSPVFSKGPKVDSKSAPVAEGKKRLDELVKGKKK